MLPMLKEEKSSKLLLLADVGNVRVNRTMKTKWKKMVIFLFSIMAQNMWLFLKGQT